MGADGSIIIDTRIDESGFGKGMARLRSGAKAGALAIGIAVGAAAAGFVHLARTAEEALVADRRLDQIAKSMRIFGDDAGRVTERLKALADVQARAVGVDDEIIKATQAKLLTFRELAESADEAGGAFDRANTAAMDMAAAGFGEAEQNAVQLGKALNDPIKGVTALSRSGVTFTAVEKEKLKALVESGKMLEAQDFMLKAIERQVGGTAAATATASDRMKVAWGEVQESLGTKLLPVFEKFSAWAIDKGIPALEKFIASIDFEAAFAAIGAWWAKVQPDLQMFLDLLVEQLKPAWEEFQRLLQDEEAMAELKKIVTGMVLVLAGLILVIAKVISIITQWQLKMLAAQLAVTAFVNGVVTRAEELRSKFVGKVTTTIDSVVGWFKKLPGKVKDALGSLSSTGKDLVIGLWNGINDKFDWLVAKIKSFASDVTDRLKAFFGIKSPSTLFEREIGVNLALGIGGGFSDKMRSVAAGMVATVRGEMGRFRTGSAGGTRGGAPSYVDNRQQVVFAAPVRSYAETVRAMNDIRAGLVG